LPGSRVAAIRAGIRIRVSRPAMVYRALKSWQRRRRSARA
jgi:hypothetical protein